MHKLQRTLVFALSCTLIGNVAASNNHAAHPHGVSTGDFPAQPATAAAAAPSTAAAQPNAANRGTKHEREGDAAEGAKSPKKSRVSTTTPELAQIVMPTAAQPAPAASSSSSAAAATTAHAATTAATRTYRLELSQADLKKLLDEIGALAMSGRRSRFDIYWSQIRRQLPVELGNIYGMAHEPDAKHQPCFDGNHAQRVFTAVAAITNNGTADNADVPTMTRIMSEYVASPENYVPHLLKQICTPTLHAEIAGIKEKATTIMNTLHFSALWFAARAAVPDQDFPLNPFYMEPWSASGFQFYGDPFLTDRMRCGKCGKEVWSLQPWMNPYDYHDRTKHEPEFGDLASEWDVDGIVGTLQARVRQHLTNKVDRTHTPWRGIFSVRASLMHKLGSVLTEITQDFRDQSEDKDERFLLACAGDGMSPSIHDTMRMVDRYTRMIDLYCHNRRNLPLVGVQDAEAAEKQRNVQLWNDLRDLPTQLTTARRIVQAMQDILEKPAATSAAQ